MRRSAAVLLLLAASCATQRSVPPGEPETFRAAPPAVAVEHRWSPPAANVFWPTVSAPDLSSWPEGWVNDPEGARFGLPERFWSERRVVWLEGLNASPAAAAYRFERIYRAARQDEAFRAAWRLWLTYSRAGLGDEARTWLDRAWELKPDPAIGLERAWDQTFRLRDLWGARALWADAGQTDLRKYRLLRQKLFLGSQSLVPAGGDDYISSLQFDRDDLWAATWNGAVARWSLVTGAIDLIRPAGDTVSPIRFLAVTGWFIYAFQDKSLLRYSKVAGTWRTFPYPDGWNGLRVQGAVAEGQETLWVGHLGEGLWKWDRGQWSQIDAGGGGPFINALASDGRGGLWVGTKDRGLWSWSAGMWTRVPSLNGSPSNIAVLEPSPDGSALAVGTWGEGAWLLEKGLLRRVFGDKYVTAAAWTADGPLWGTLEHGVIGPQRSLGPLDGVPSGVSALAVWQGRWIWGTAEQGLGWWSEDENSAIPR